MLGNKNTWTNNQTANPQTSVASTSGTTAGEETQIFDSEIESIQIPETSKLQASGKGTGKQLRVGPVRRVRGQGRRRSQSLSSLGRDDDGIKVNKRKIHDMMNEMSNERRLLDGQQGPSQQPSEEGMDMDEAESVQYPISAEDEGPFKKARQIYLESNVKSNSQDEQTILSDSSSLDSPLVIPGGSLYIGSSDFVKLVNQKVMIVDKSMLIGEFVDINQDVSLVLRPRRFGKSTNLSMLRLFFERIEGETENMKQSRMELFNQFKIMKERPKLFTEEFGKYPVIFLTLKEIKGETWEIMEKNLQRLIGNIYRMHRYLLPTLEVEERDEFGKIMKIDKNFPHFETALQNLSKYLHRHHDSKCVVLVDEYDAPMEVAYNYGYYNKALEFLGMLFSSLLKDNSHLHKALVVGVFRIAKTGFLSGLNNLCVNSMASRPFADKFGFAKEEVELLLHRHGVNRPIDIVRLWYNGYRSGNRHHQYALFNPWSVIHLCLKGGLVPYWSDTEGTSRIMKLLPGTSSKFKNDVLQLMCKNAIDVTIGDNIIYETLTTNNDHYIWVLLCDAGYITRNDEGKLIIPNYECWMEWVKWTMPSLCNTKTISTFFCELLMIKGDTGDTNEIKHIENIEGTLQNAIKQFLEFRGSMHGLSEGFYQDVIVSLLFPFDQYNVHSQRDEEKGDEEKGDEEKEEFSIYILPTVRAGFPADGCAMKLKMAAENETVIDASDRAIYQFSMDNDDSKFPDNVVTVWLYAIGFKGEEVHVRMWKKTRKEGEAS